MVIVLTEIEPDFDFARGLVRMGTASELQNHVNVPTYRVHCYAVKNKRESERLGHEIYHFMSMSRRSLSLLSPLQISN